MNHQDEEKIDRYLKGEMTDSERKEFEQTLLENDHLRRNTTEQAMAIQAIRQYASREEERMFKAMQALSEKEFMAQLREQVIKPSPKRHRIAWAVCTLTAAACISGVIYLRTQYNFYNNIEAELAETQTLIQLPVQEEILRGEEVDDTVRLKLQEASDCIRQKKYAKAIVLLKPIVEEGDINRHYQDACWQLSLCYLLNKEKNNAVSLLRQIVEEKQYQAEKASLLLRKLE